MRVFFTVIAAAILLTGLAGCPLLFRHGAEAQHNHYVRPERPRGGVTRDQKVAYELEDIQGQLHQENEYDRQAALFTLRGYPTAAQPLLPDIIAMVTDDDSLNVRTAAVEALYAVAESPLDQLPVFIAALGDKEVKVKTAAAKAIGWLGPAAAAAIPDLERVLAGSWWSDAQAAADALRRIDPDHLLRLVPNYIECLKLKSPEDRIAAAYALGCIGPYPQAPALAYVDRGLDTSSLERRECGLRLFLQYSGVKDVERVSGDLDPRVAMIIPALLNAFKTEQDPKVQWMIIRALGKFQHHALAANDLLSANLTNSDKYIREAAAYSLAELGPTDERSVTALVNALRDPEETVAIDAMRALRERGPASVAALSEIELLINPDDVGDMQENIGMFITALGPAAAPLVPRIIEVLERNIPWTAPIYATAVGSIGPAAADAIPALSKLYEDGDHSSLFAAEALSRIDPSGRRVGKILTRGLTSDNATVQAGGAIGLANLEPSPANVKALTALARSDDNRVVMAAARALSEEGAANPDVIPALVDALATDRYVAAFQAALALMQNGETHPELRPRILQALDDRGLLGDHRGGLVAGWLVEDDTQAVTYLSQALGLATEPSYPATAALGLARRGPVATTAVPQLQACLDYADAEAQLAAAHALCCIQPQALATHVPLLSGWLYSGSGEFAAEVIWILGELGPLAESALPALRVASHADDAENRQRAIIAIAKINGE